jgi:hypothetical protein
VLCHFPEGIAIYRKGKHDLTVPPEQITEYSLSFGNTLQYLLVPGLLIFAMVTAFMKTGADWNLAILTAIVAASMSSLIYTRLLCGHRLVPRQSRFTQEVLFRRKDIERLFA